MLTYDFDMVKVEKLAGITHAIWELSTITTILPFKIVLTIISGEPVKNTFGTSSLSWYNIEKSLIDVILSLLIFLIILIILRNSFLLYLLFK